MLQEQATRSHGWSMLLWNREEEEAKKGWWPAWEDTLSNLVCAFLREHLAGHKLVINREVEIWPVPHRRKPDRRPRPGVRPPGRRRRAAHRRHRGQGLLEPRDPDRRHRPAPSLPARPGWAGIFLVGYFHSPEHEHPKYKGFPKEGAKPAKQGRHRTSKRHTPGQVLSNLQQQADSAPESLIYARVLQLPLVLPSAPGTESA